MSLRFEYDEAASVVRLEGRELSLADPEAFELISRAWLRSGWDTKYVYGFSWLGRPVIQLPEDLIRIQELIHELQPDVIVETGVAHGGSLIFYAGLCAAMGKGRVIGIDIEIRPHNRDAIEAHRLSPMIRLVEGSSTADAVVQQVRDCIAPAETVLVLLDSNHSKEHVAAELEAYAPLVTPGSYIVACDGIMQQVAGAPRTETDWTWNNPISAVGEFLATHPDFEAHEPAWPFNEGLVRQRVSYWPQAYLRRRISPPA
jgi:cephalosporin hydroxylase